MISPRIIAVDFDGTLVENRWPEIGPTREDVCARLREAQRKGAQVILWTCRSGRLLADAAVWCLEHGIRLDAINANLPDLIELYGSDTRKIFATEYWDDAAVPVK